MIFLRRVDSEKRPKTSKMRQLIPEVGGRSECLSESVCNDIKSSNQSHNGQFPVRFSYCHIELIT